VRILEIGVQNGGSLEIWSRFFPKAEHIVGCDNNSKCQNLKYDDPRISVVVGDANARNIVETIASISRYFDIIIDDGSHRSEDIVKTFALYFPMLLDGGLFVAEDLHCSYWAGFQGGIEAPYSSVNFFKRLADYVNREHWGVPVAADAMLSWFASFWQTQFDASALEKIGEVRFRNSIVAVSKSRPGGNLLGRQIVAWGSTFSGIVDPLLIRWCDVNDFNIPRLVDCLKYLSPQ
jgi:hypothetical protein